MKSKTVLWCGLALGIVAATVFLRERNRDAALSGKHPTAVTGTGTAKPAVTADHRPAAVSPSLLSSREMETPALPPLLSHAETRAAVHTKLRQWLGTGTGDTEAQETLTQELLALLTDENTAEIIQSLSADELGTPFGAGALARWLKQDATQAARWLATRPDATEEHALLVARRMLADPAELHAYCDQLPEGGWKQKVLNSASLEAVAKDPLVAVALAQRLTAGEARTNALETIAYDWVGRDLPAAADWIKNVDDPQLRERLFAVGAKAIANADPDLAAGWLVMSVKTEGVLNETALSLVETWTDQHPSDAADWVAHFSEAGPRKTAIDLVLSHWLKSDPTAANAWIQTLPEREAILAKLKADQAARERPPDPE